MFLSWPCHSYLFFDIEQGLPKVSDARSKKIKKEFIMCASDARGIRTQAYATLAFKAGTRFMLHVNAETPEEIQRFVRDLLHTELGKRSKLSYSLFGLTRSSQYNPAHAPKEADWDLAHKYLVVYPFTKTIEWHLMPYDERRTIMKAHVEVGRKHSDKISQQLLYAYGIDDHEFIVSYYMDDLEAFQTLVMDMRGTESRRHTKNDLPIFMCVHMPLKDALDML
jgi:chlorite dismutase